MDCFKPSFTDKMFYVMMLERFFRGELTFVEVFISSDVFKEGLRRKLTLLTDRNAIFR